MTNLISDSIIIAAENVRLISKESKITGWFIKEAVHKIVIKNVNGIHDIFYFNNEEGRDKEFKQLQDHLTELRK